METKKQIYLLKNGETVLKFAERPPSKSFPTVLLFTPKLEDFKYFPYQTYDPEIVAKISEIIDAASKQDGGKANIEMYGKYDAASDVPKIYTKVSFPKEFVKLSNILPDTRISVKGTYKVVKPYKVMQYYFPSSTGGAGTVSCVTEWDGVGDQEQEFSVENILLKENAVYETFNGIQKMEELYKSHGYSNAKLTYSVILESKHFGWDARELGLNVLEKLYKDKPFSDVTIVASNNKELECHRIILAMFSDVLLTMLNSGMKESGSGRIEMKDVCEDALHIMLDFMYGRKPDLHRRSEEVILDLLKAAHKYNICELEVHTSRFLLNQHNVYFTINGVLNLYFFVVNVDHLNFLAEKMLNIMKKKPQEVSASTIYQEWKERKPQDAEQFLMELMEPPENN